MCWGKKKENSQGRYASAVANLRKDVDGLKLEDVFFVVRLFVGMKEGGDTNGIGVYIILCISYNYFQGSSNWIDLHKY